MDLNNTYSFPGAKSIVVCGYIQACGHSILCIGGAVSIDRSHRIAYDKAHAKSEKSSYWTDEMPVWMR